MLEADEKKLNSVMALWAEHEFWIQAGCPDLHNHCVRFPGYSTLGSQDARGYGLYRNALVPYFAEALGYPRVHESLIALIECAEQRHPALVAEMLVQYEYPKDRFCAQWGNLFRNMFRDGMTHSSLADYQAKYEVDLPLCFLAHLREIVSDGTLDVQLQRFRDGNGRLRKGVIAKYLIDGLHDFPELQAAFEKGYKAKLRNAVGHNAYTLDDGVFSSHDRDYRITNQEFRDIFEAIQIVQNAIVWFLISQRSNHTNLATKGILGVGWNVESDLENDIPSILVFQLAPFYMLDESCAWLTQARVSVGDDGLTTILSDNYPIKGKLSPEVEEIVDVIRRRGVLNCVVIPVMPCIHSHDSFCLVDGEYCQSMDEQEVEVVAQVLS